MTPSKAIGLGRKFVQKSRHPNFMHVCIVIRGGAIKAIAVNHGGIHAEIRALNQIWPNKSKGSTLISLRFTSGGLLASAKPCADCQTVIDSRGIKDVVYSTSKRQLLDLRSGEALVLGT